MPDTPPRPPQDDREWLREKSQRVRAQAKRQRQEAQAQRQRARQIKQDNATMARYAGEGRDD